MAGSDFKGSQLEPQQDVLERALDRLDTIVYPVPKLTGAVRLLL